MFGDAPLSDAAIQSLLIQAWGWQPGSVVYVPIGYGGYHWRATSSDGDVWFVTADRIDDGTAVAAAYRLARQLAEDGLEFVRAPRPHRDDAAVWEIDGWLISVWPWLDGRASTDHGHGSAADLGATLGCVRRLHEHGTVHRLPDLTEDWAIADRAQFGEMVERGEWGTGPYGDEVRFRALTNRGRIDALFARYDELAEAAADSEFVITHGEPHAGNVVHTKTGPMLIDWDTVLWAPRERDLWSLTRYDGWRQVYGDDVEISKDRLELYRLQWSLSEIAEFVTLLAAADATSLDLDVAMGELRGYLPLD